MYLRLYVFLAINAFFVASRTKPYQPSNTLTLSMVSKPAPIRPALSPPANVSFDNSVDGVVVKVIIMAMNHGGYSVLFRVNNRTHKISIIR